MIYELFPLQGTSSLEDFPGVNVSLGSGLTTSECTMRQIHLGVSEVVLGSGDTKFDYSDDMEEDIIICVLFELRDCIESGNTATQRCMWYIP